MESDRDREPQPWSFLDWLTVLTAVFAVALCFGIIGADALGYSPTGNR